MTPSLSDAALVQQRLWGSEPEVWAALAEPHNRPLFEAVLDATGVRAGTRLLDVGCGSAMTLVLAHDRGAVVHGSDVSPGLLGVARRRLPAADLRLGEMERLPWDDASMDVVVGVNAFQFAGDPVAALREAVRVVVPHGVVAASLFSAPERNESTVVHDAMSRLSPPARDGEHLPYQLSAPGNLESAFRSAGLTPTASGSVALDWDYASLDDAVAGLLCSGGGTRAVQDAGRATAASVVRDALLPFLRPDGRVVMRNEFRFAVGRAEPAPG